MKSHMGVQNYREGVVVGDGFQKLLRHAEPKLALVMALMFVLTCTVRNKRYCAGTFFVHQGTNNVYVF